MDHRQAQRLFDDYFAGHLDRGATREFHAHLKECDACAARLRLLRAQAVGGRDRAEHGLASPETQAQMARNRDLLVKVLILLVFAWAVWKMKH